MTDASNRVAIVTGAARNIGRPRAVALAGQGFDLLVHAHNDRDGAEETARQAESAGARARVVLADLTERESAGRLVAGANEMGRVGVLVNNAALRQAVAFRDMTLEQWRAIMTINLEAPFLCAQACIGDMVDGGWGRIVNIGGLSGHRGASKRAHVIASKAALVGLTKALATEFAGTGITANCVVPGEIDTKRGASAGVPGHHPNAAPPLVGRRGKPNDIAAMIAMLCGDGGEYITGQTLHVNGGIYLP